MFWRAAAIIVLCAGPCAASEQAAIAGTTVTNASVVTVPEPETPPTSILPNMNAGIQTDGATVPSVVGVSMPAAPSHSKSPRRAPKPVNQDVVTAGPKIFVPPSPVNDATSDSAWPVATSLKSTLRSWADRQGWPPPQFLTQVDWIVDVPGSIPGQFEDALKALSQGFERASSRPRIEVSANHVMLISEVGSQ